MLNLYNKDVETFRKKEVIIWTFYHISVLQPSKFITFCWLKNDSYATFFWLKNDKYAFCNYIWPFSQLMNAEEMHKNVERLDELDSHLDEARDILIVSSYCFPFLFFGQSRHFSKSTVTFNSFLLLLVTLGPPKRCYSLATYELWTKV